MAGDMVIGSIEFTTTPHARDEEIFDVVVDDDDDDNDAGANAEDEAQTAAKIIPITFIVRTIFD